jgi:hypothetical protein
VSVDGDPVGPDVQAHGFRITRSPRRAEGKRWMDGGRLGQRMDRQATERTANPTAGAPAGHVGASQLPEPPTTACARVLELQRAVGNRAVAAMVARRPWRMIARDDKPLLSKTGGEYEYKLEHKGERTSWSLRFSFSKAQTSPIRGKADVGEKGPSAGDVSAQGFASKMSRTKTAGAKAANSMALALGKLDLTVAQPWPGISVNADLKALEAKVEAGKVDVNVFKIGLMVQGKLSKDLEGTALGDVIMGSELGKAILEGTVVKIQGRFEINVDPSDVARLARLVQANTKIARETARGLKAKRSLDALHAQQELLKRQLKNRRAKLGKAAIKRLEGRIAANANKIGTLTQRIAKSKAAVEGLKKTAQAAAKGLKSKAGRLMGAAIAKAGGKFLLKLVPGLNLVLLAVDIYSVSKALYDLFTGKAKLGLPTGAEGGGGKGVEGGTADAGTTQGEAGEGSGGAGADAGRAGGEGGAPAGEFVLPPDINIDDSADAGESQPDLHPGAKRVLEQIAGATGRRLDPADFEELNLLVPQDITDAEAAKLAARFKVAEQGAKGDPFAGLAGVVEEVRNVRRDTPTTTATDASGTEKLADPEKVPTPSDEPGSDGRARRPDARAGGKADEAKGGTGGGTGAGGATGKGKGGAGTSQGAGKGTGEAGKGLRELGKPAPVAAGKLYYPGKDEPAGQSVSKFGFRIVSGYNPSATYAAGSNITITIEFQQGGRTYKPTFTVRVTSHTKTADKIVLEAVNARRWRIADTPVEMPEGEPLTITSTRGGNPKK